MIASVLFGTLCLHYETPTVTNFFHIHHMWEHAIEPGAHPLVYLLPILHYVPEHLEDFVLWSVPVAAKMLEYSEKHIRENDRNRCFMEDVLDKSEKLSMDWEMIGWVVVLKSHNYLLSKELIHCSDLVLFWTGTSEECWRSWRYNIKPARRLTMSSDWDMSQRLMIGMTSLMSRLLWRR